MPYPKGDPFVMQDTKFVPVGAPPANQAAVSWVPRQMVGTLPGKRLTRMTINRRDASVLSRSTHFNIKH